MTTYQNSHPGLGGFPTPPAEKKSDHGAACVFTALTAKVRLSATLPPQPSSSRRKDVTGASQGSGM